MCAVDFYYMFAYGNYIFHFNVTLEIAGDEQDDGKQNCSAIKGR